MKFEQALNLMREGKRVRVAYWDTLSYLYLYDNQILDESDERYSISISELLGNGWELYEEPKKKVTKWLWMHKPTGKICISDHCPVLYSEEEFLFNPKNNYQKLEWSATEVEV